MNSTSGNREYRPLPEIPKNLPIDNIVKTENKPVIISKRYSRGKPLPKLPTERVMHHIEHSMQSGKSNKIEGDFTVKAQSKDEAFATEKLGLIKGEIKEGTKIQTTIENPKLKSMRPQIQEILKKSLSNDILKDDTEVQNDLHTSPLQKGEKGLISKDLKAFTCEYKDDKGTSIGTVEAKQNEAIATSIMIQEKTKTRLEQDIKDLEISLKPDNELLKSLNKQLEFCKGELKNLSALKEKGVHFFSSNYNRGELDANKKLSLKDASSKLCRSAYVNGFSHSIKTSNEEKGWHLRVGVMTDHAKGHTHLEELKELSQSPEKLASKIASLNQKLSEIVPKKGTGKKIESLQNAIDELTNRDLKELITEREQVLSAQFLPLLMGHINKNFDKIENETGQQNLSMTHLALLNQETQKIDKTGWVHNESSQMADMKALFDMFDGKTLIFDGKGPYVDNNGNVHLPQQMVDTSGEPRELKLETQFVNLSVQNNLKNDGQQAVFNKEGMIKLIDQTGDKIRDAKDDKTRARYLEAWDLLKSVKSHMEKGESSFEMAEDLAFAMSLLDMHFSIGCLSAKDRTGYVSERVMLRHLERDMRDSVKPDIQENLMTKWSQQMVQEGVSLNIIKTNGHLAFKCTALNMPGLNKSLKGIAVRLALYVKVAGAAVPALGKILKKSPVKAIRL